MYNSALLFFLIKRDLDMANLAGAILRLKMFVYKQ